VLRHCVDLGLKFSSGVLVITDWDSVDIDLVSEDGCGQTKALEEVKVSKALLVRDFPLKWHQKGQGNKCDEVDFTLEPAS